MSKFYVCISNLLEPYKSKPLKKSLRKKLVKLLTSRQERKLDWNKNERLVWVTRFARTSEMLQSCGRGQKIINIFSPTLPPTWTSVLRPPRTVPSWPSYWLSSQHSLHQFSITSPSQSSQLTALTWTEGDLLESLFDRYITEKKNPSLL